MRNTHLKARDAAITPGEAAPDFALLDQARNEWKLSAAIKDGSVALCFYPMDFSSVCADEMNALEATREALIAANITPVGISCDSFYVHEAWAKSLGLSHSLLADMHREVCRAYGFFFPDLNVASRGTVVIGTDGIVKWSQARELKDAMDIDEVLAATGA